MQGKNRFARMFLMFRHCFCYPSEFARGKVRVDYTYVVFFEDGGLTTKRKVWAFRSSRNFISWQTVNRTLSSHGSTWIFHNLISVLWVMIVHDVFSLFFLSSHSNLRLLPPHQPDDRGCLSSRRNEVMTCESRKSLGNLQNNTFFILVKIKIK